jgi:glycosyltransferase involved in cell wall biosynthesis
VSTWRRHLPTVAKTAAKDLREWDRARKFRVEPVGPWGDSKVEFVWQRHDLFHDAGIQLARQLDVPSVLFVPAVVVWESQQWEVARPGWSHLLERFGEQPALRSADLIACGSDLVAEQVRRLGADEQRMIVTPSGADLNLFGKLPDRDRVRAELRLTNRFVIGWVGSFRKFHALDQAVEALAGLEGATLLLVGDGPERARVRELGRESGVAIRLTGTVPYQQIPKYLAAMDVALVLGSPDQPFHYSPLKLAEYLAAGLPVVAPNVAQLHDRLTDGLDAMLVPLGDASALAGALKQLRDDPDLRGRLSEAARESARRNWSWDSEMRRILERIGVATD